VLQIAEAVLFMRTLEHCIHDPHMATMSGVIGNQPRLHGMFDEAVATLQQMARPRGATVVLPWLLAGIGDKPLRSYMYDICLKCLCIELIDNPGRYGIPTTVGKDPKRAALTLGTLDADRLAQLASRALVRIVDFFGVSIAAQLTRAGRHVELINLLEQLRRTYPSAMGCQHAYGMQLVQDGSLQDARIVVYEALEMYGTNAIRVLGLDILGQILDAEGQHASANLVVRQVLALAPGDAAALHAQVRHWVKAGDRSQAEHALEELIAAHPESGFVASAKAMLASAWPTR
jgi:tetratricopeptide (TPR) repeat protein